MKVLFAFAVVIWSAVSTIDAFRVPYYELSPNKPAEIVSSARQLLSGVLKSDIVSMEKKSFEKPWFCHNLDCPVFKVLNKTENYELREYEDSRWVSTEQLNLNYDDASGVMFMKLFEYIEGNNQKNEKIAMTAPVINRVIPGQGPACKNNFTMSFFMAPVVKDPPAPKDKTVFLSSLPKQKWFVSSFSGRASGSSWISNGEKLAEVLKKEGKKFDSTFYYTAGYDSPFRILDRHNEVWFKANE